MTKTTHLKRTSKTHMPFWYTLINPDGYRCEAIECCLQKHQPGLFGPIAASLHMMHFCFLTDRDIFLSDKHKEIGWPRGRTVSHQDYVSRFGKNIGVVRKLPYEVKLKSNGLKKIIGRELPFVPVNHGLARAFCYWVKSRQRRKSESLMSKLEPLNFKVPKDGQTFIDQVISRCRNLIYCNIWSGLPVQRLNQWWNNFTTEEEKYFAACLLDM